jgi:mono/diheme cytochrome c family protein
MRAAYKRAMCRVAALLPPARLALAVLLALAAPLGRAQDATRGAALYRALPGDPGVGSCTGCHGEPLDNRNSVLRGAAGGPLIARTINAVGAMGYLRQYLGEPELADIAAYLASVVPAGALEVLPAPWPTGHDFGLHEVGTQAPERSMVVRNLQPRGEIAIGAVVSSDVLAFPLQHDCPLALPPLGQCLVRTAFRPQAEGAAAARWDVLDTGGRPLRGGTLRGHGGTTPAPALAWDGDVPAGELIDFGRVAPGARATRRFALVNPGPRAVTVTRLRATGPDAARFTLAGACATNAAAPGPVRLEAGARCALELTFAPAQAGRAEGWIELEADARNAPPLRLQGQGAVAQPPPPLDEPATPPGAGAGASAPAFLVGLALAIAMLRRR